MRPLTARAVLELWESAACQHPVDRALTLLAVACPGPSRDELAELAVGERDARLLALYQQLFGAEMVAFTHCPGCGERFVLRLSVPELCQGLGGAAAVPGELADGGIELRFRPLDSRDLAAAVTAAAAGQARRLLAERSVVEARRGGTPIAPRELPEELIERLAERLAECDPGAEILLDVDCLECRHHFSAPLDAGEFLWTELSVLARRLVREVATLARVHAWSEAEILAMSHPRRRAYLEAL